MLRLPAAERLRVNEIFYSIQGESTFAGRPCVLVRLTGCQMRCRWCDSDYSFYQGEWMSRRAVVERVEGYGCPLVELTGGEPLLQPGALPLLVGGFQVLLETGVGLDVSTVDPRVHRIVDVKCPGSGEVDNNHWPNLDVLTGRDEVKLVLADEDDYRWARDLVCERRLYEVCPVHFSPVHGELDISAAGGMDPARPATGAAAAPGPQVDLGRRGSGGLGLSRPIQLGCLLAVLLAICAPAGAVDNERLYLSGTGLDDAIEWEFFCTGGRHSGHWTTIPVPSQWELQGFGTFNYGHDQRKSREQGRYRRRFQPPEAWRGRRVEVVFEGVMTDAEAWLNGEPAGERHQGGFYRFSYDVTDLLRFGEENLLEVLVSKHSADTRVNRAERDADYWVFGGIYRPVYLEVSPVEGIEHFAVAARHDGSFLLRAFLRGGTGFRGAGLLAPGRLEARVETLEGKPVGSTLAVTVGAGGRRAEIEGSIPGVRPWSAERPRLYRVHLELSRDGEVLHRLSDRFGFRTVEVRRGEGLFVNDRRVMLKGVNRHAFWPSSGRTLSPELDRRDAELIQAMNLNAVRASHYPPDVAFLEACDELGIYVIDELAGWHDAYGSRIGRQLVGEMVRRDVNHPSILIWANGNEGGWNKQLDAVFGDHDLQRRPVLHPDETAGGIDTHHYPTYSELAELLDPASSGNRWRRLLGELPLVMPTEMLHGLYDGGSGAGLETYWELLRSSPRGAGAFLWSFLDEAVVRDDRGGVLDTDGNHAPDGILGPYRERSGSFYAVREVFAPIRIDEAESVVHQGILKVENRFNGTDLSHCRFPWGLVDFPAPGEAFTPGLLAGGDVSGPRVPPGATGELTLPLGDSQADALRLAARDPRGREVARWVLPLRDLRSDYRALGEGDAAVTGEERSERVILSSGAMRVEIDRATGGLVTLGRGERALALPGPRRADGGAQSVTSVQRSRDGSAEIVEARYEAGLESIRWSLHSSGWLRCELRYAVDGTGEYHGAVFDLARRDLLRFRWLGDGPARVWGNRLEGGTLGVWSKGATHTTSVSSAFEPVLEGFYAGVYWAQLSTGSGELLLAVESDDFYLGLFTPAFPEDARDAVAAVPSDAGVGLYGAIPAIGTKFHPAAELAPASPAAAGEQHAVFWMRLE